MTARRRARLAAVQVLFELDFQSRAADEVIAERLADTSLTDENRAFTRDLVHGVLHHREDIDARIALAAPQWPVEQIAHVDKNVLRLAIYELMFDNSAPAKVVITEAIELARLLGSATSPKFVNGVLGAVVGKEPAGKGR
ncbi:MAG TPA: transcription antitermination factor NusB [Chloroflexota bacterium]|nr:transcription antitermination factor NusB [Chloroflexota bacterium]